MCGWTTCETHIHTDNKNAQIWSFLPTLDSPFFLGDSVNSIKNKYHFPIRITHFLECGPKANPPCHPYLNSVQCYIIVDGQSIEKSTRKGAGLIHQTQTNLEDHED